MNCSCGGTTSITHCDIHGDTADQPIPPTEQAAPRQWWIINSLMSGRTWISEGPLNPNHQEKPHEVHVIEFSAYEKLEAQRDKLSHLLTVRSRGYTKDEAAVAIYELERCRETLKAELAAALTGSVSASAEKPEHVRKERDALKAQVESLQGELLIEKNANNKDFRQGNDAIAMLKSDLSKAIEALSSWEVRPSLSKRPVIKEEIRALLGQLRHAHQAKSGGSG